MIAAVSLQLLYLIFVRVLGRILLSGAYGVIKGRRVAGVAA